MLEKLDRRELLAALQGLPVFATVDLSTLFNAPRIAPEEFLNQCNANMEVCWQLLQHKGFATVEKTISAFIPTLSHLALTSSKYQDLAATFMVQAKVLQDVVVMHRMDFVSREIICMETVRYGELSGNPSMHALGLLEMAYAYIDRPNPMPDKAIPLFLEALTCTRNQEVPALQCDLYVCLAQAYAQSGNEAEALKALEQSEALFSERSNASQDLGWFYGDGFPEFYPQKSRVYLNLASHTSGDSYFKKAYDVLVSGSDQRTTRGVSENAIFQADAARGLGDINHFIDLLEKGARLALEIGSKKRQQEALAVLAKAPESWQKEQRYQQLVRMF